MRQEGEAAVTTAHRIQGKGSQWEGSPSPVGFSGEVALGGTWVYGKGSMEGQEGMD